MKISNSKKELAKIISENGGWKCLGDFAAQCREGAAISFYMDKPKHNQGEPVHYGDYCGSRHDIHPDILLPNWHQTIISRVEYFHLYPVPDADGWVEWKGGECPVAPSDIVEYLMINDTADELHADKAGDLRWSKSGSAGDIAFYRLYKSRSLQEVVSSDTEEQQNPTIEKLAADYRNKLDYADRKQDEADNARVESDAALSELEKAIAAIGFAITPIDVVAQEPARANPNWRNWLRGDEIKCKKTPPRSVKSIGLTGYVSKVYGDCVEVAFEHHIAVAFGCLIDECFEFVNRPAK